MSEKEAKDDETDQSVLAYFGVIKVKKSDENWRIVLQNYLLQAVSSFSLSDPITDICLTHNYVFFLVPLQLRIYVFRIDSVFVYCLDIDRIQDSLRFKLTDINVKVEEMATVNQNDGMSAEIAFMKVWQKRVQEINVKEIDNFLLCGTSRSCFLVKNADSGPTMYRIFTENKIQDFQMLQLGFCEAVLQLCSGNGHILILTAIGRIYSMGTGSRGELGHGTLECEQQPRLVESLSVVKVIQVACGSWHSVALTADGDVYVWGWNKYGQLGNCCAEGEIQDFPTPLDFDECWSAVEAYRNATLLKRNDHSVLTLGTADFISS